MEVDKHIKQPTTNFLPLHSSGALALTSFLALSVSPLMITPKLCHWPIDPSLYCCHFFHTSDRNVISFYHYYFFFNSYSLRALSVSSFLIVYLPALYICFLIFLIVPSLKVYVYILIYINIMLIYLFTVINSY
jgi:hypothetical protein